MTETDNYKELVNQTRNDHNDRLTLDKLHNLNKGRDICDRLFESYVIDLRIAIRQYYNNALDDLSFVTTIKEIHSQLESLAPGAEVRKVLERANLVILSKISRDIENTEDKNGIN